MGWLRGGCRVVPERFAAEWFAAEWFAAEWFAAEWLARLIGQRWRVHKHIHSHDDVTKTRPFRHCCGCQKPLSEADSRIDVGPENTA